MRTALMALGCSLSVSLVGAQASAYDVKMSETGEPLRWGATAINIDMTVEEGPDAMDRTAVEEAIALSIAAWDEVLPDGVTLLPEIQDGAPALPDAEDGDNIVRWIAEGWNTSYQTNALAVTLTTYDPDNARIIDADVLLNSDQYKWTVDPTLGDCTYAYDLQSIVTHEIGHFLGLGHSSDPEATMYALTDPCNLKQRDLHADDLAGLDYLYVELGPIAIAEPGTGGSFGCDVARRRTSSSTLPIVALATLLLFSRRIRRYAPRKNG